MDIEIRQVEKGDIEEILNIERASFPTPWIASFFEEELKSPVSQAYCASLTRMDRLLVGYTISHSILDELHLLNIAVRKEFRRKGIGTRLFRHSLEMNPHVRIVYLEVREHNSAARAFYRKLGFREIGRRWRYYSDTGEDAVTMAWMSDQ